MIKHYLVAAFRSLKVNRIFTGLNFVSLVGGLLVMYVAVGYLRFEFGYDKFHKNSEQIYRVARTLRAQDYAVIGFQDWNSTSARDQTAQAQQIEEIPGVEAAVQFMISPASEFVETENNKIVQDKILTTNTPEAFANVFSWQLQYGSFITFAERQNSIILTQSTAETLFGTENPGNAINKSINIGSENYAVAAIIKDVPGNSHFDFNIALNKEQIDYWGTHMYLQLAQNSDPKAVEQRYNEAILDINTSLGESEIYKGHFFQPITDIHLKSNLLYELKQPGNYQYCLLIGGFALFILIITLFNYTNFTLAIKTKQAKTIGVRKALGASEQSIATQFVIEGVLLAIIAIPVVVMLISVVVPSFNQLMDTQVNTFPLASVELMGLLIVLAMLLGLIASALPALYLSKQDTLNLFREKLKNKGFEQFSVRKYLVVSQFVIMIGVTSISYFVYKQVAFIENKDLGFRKSGIVYTNSSEENLDVFQQKISQIPGVEIVGNGSALGIETFNQETYKLEGEETIFDDANRIYLDYKALKAYGIKTTLNQDGRSLVTDAAQPVRTLINITAAERFAAVKNIPINALIGTTIISEPEYQNEDGTIGFPFIISGFYEDIHLFSLREKIKPYFIVLSENVRMYGQSIVAFDPSRTAEVLQDIAAVHNQLNEQYPLEIEFLDENFSELHRKDKQMARLIFVLNAIAVFLALLGIVGITLLLIAGRTKEIGIRKLLGASVGSILKISVKEYVGFVAVAFLIAWPLAWFVTRSWLNNFAYQIEVEQPVFALIALLTLTVTVVLVAGVSWRAAVSNPVNSLRTE
ncbi:MAG: FtsX-like permease family protein [Leeuwenhoekiella sp.]